MRLLTGVWSNQTGPDAGYSTPGLSTYLPESEGGRYSSREVRRSRGLAQVSGRSDVPEGARSAASLLGDGKPMRWVADACVRGADGTDPSRPQPKPYNIN
jgi:hypothetical protein